MTTVTRALDIAPLRSGLSQIDFSDPAVWSNRLRLDRARAVRNQTKTLGAVTAAIEYRSRKLGASGLILSGSTARGRRTRVSDLDYHVIGARPDIRDLPHDIDLYCDEPNRFAAKLRSGDDFAHWSIWYGCVLFDSGVVQAGAAYLAENDAWPDAQRKFRQAEAALEFSERLLPSGDYHATLENVRGALSLTARWWLLTHDIFPLARDELSGQLLELEERPLAEALRVSIHELPTIAVLSRGVAVARALTESGRPAGPRADGSTAGG